MQSAQRASEHKLHSSVHRTIKTDILELLLWLMFDTYEQHHLEKKTLNFYETHTSHR